MAGGVLTAGAAATARAAVPGGVPAAAPSARRPSVADAMAAGGGVLLFSAAAAPGAPRWLLPDLATRLAAGPVFRLQPLSEEELAALLAERARERGLKLGAEVARFMVMRSERSPALLLERLAVLDRTALARQRAPTIPFIKDVFGW